jgi:hypothetical protein
MGCPVIDALLLDHDAYLLAPGAGIKVAYALDETAIASFATVGHDNVVKRTLFGPAPC